MIARSVKLLPEPDSPTMPKASPASNGEGDGLYGVEALVTASHRDRQVLYVEGRAHEGGRNASASPSPRRDRPSPVRATARPGKVASSQWVVMKG